MYAKSVHDRLQKLLRHAGTRAHPLRGVLAIPTLLAIISIGAFLGLGEQGLEPEVTTASADVSPAVEGPALDTPQRAPQPASAKLQRTDEGRYEALAEFLSRKYKVSERVLFNLVSMAHHAGRQIGVDPLLIIAVMAVESRFNPIAESLSGAKGLMQVIPKYHFDKLKGYGGEQSVFDPQTNILVGSQILKEYIARTGSVNAALQMYAGALDDAEDVYTSKVMSEKQRLQQVVSQPARIPPAKRPARKAEDDSTPI